MARSSIQPDEQSPIPGNDSQIVRSVRDLSRFRFSRAFQHPISITADYTIRTEEDRIILVDATAGVVTITLPPADSADEVEYVVKKTDVSANAVTLATPGAETIDGAATVVLASQFNLVRVASDDTNYLITGT